MTEARIGRLLPACLHQAISDQLPLRLEFYEHWLHSEGLRDGSIGLGPLTAVLGFLRTEGVAYDPVVGHAGTLAADWTVASLPATWRRSVGWLPRPLRARAALRVAGQVVRSVSPASRMSARVRRGQVHVKVESSLFCAVRERYAAPLCGFYLAVALASLGHFALPATGRIEACCATGGSTCLLAIDLGVAAVAEAATAA